VSVGLGPSVVTIGGGGTVASADITDSTATGRAIITAATAADARSAISAAASSIPALPSTGLVLDLDASGLSLGALASWTPTVGTFTPAQATGARQPVVTDYAVGAHRGVVFDGVDDCLTIPWETAINWTTIAVYVVAQLHSNSSNAFTSSGLVIGRVHADSSGTSPYYRWSIRAEDTQIQSYLGSGSSMNGGASDSRRLSAGPHIFHVCTGSSGSFSKIDGMHANAAVGTTSLSYPDNRTISLGAGDYVTRDNFWRGAIARVLIYGAVTQTAATRQQVEAYLAATYGVAGLGRSGYG
jgi:hypothetical protein